MSILSHCHGHGNTGPQRRVPRATRACAELGTVLCPSPGPLCEPGQQKLHPQPGRNSCFLVELHEEQVSPCGSGYSTSEPGTFPSLGYWHKELQQNCPSCPGGREPLLPGSARWTRHTLGPDGSRGGCQGRSHPKEFHIAMTLIRKQIYQVQTPTVISYSLQVRAVKEIKTFM